MIKQIIKRFMSLPMKLQLFSFGFSLIFVSTSLSAVAVYQVTSNVIRRNSLQYTDEIMAQSQNYLDEKFKTLILKTNYLQLNKDFQEIMAAIWFQEREISTGDQAKITDLLGQPQIENFMESPIYLEMENKSRIDWGVEGEDIIFQNRRSTIPVVLPVTLYNIKTDNQFLVINLNAAVLKQELLEMEKSANGKMFIWNQEEEVVLSGTGGREEADILLGLLTRQGKENKDYQASVRTLDTNGWSIGCLQNKQILLKDVKQIRRMIGAIGIFSVIIFSFIDRYYGKADYSFHCLLGMNDTSYSVKWALLPLYEYTKDKRYLAAAAKALDWVEKNLYALEYVPSHYYFENKIWENRAFVDTGFCPEGFEQYQKIAGDRDYKKTFNF